MLRNVFLGFIKLHIVYHATEGPVFGLDLIRELERHGSRLSPGTLYPLLHTLEAEGYLTCAPQVVNGKVRKYYQITDAGREALLRLRPKVRELVDEVLGDGEIQ